MKKDLFKKSLETKMCPYRPFQQYIDCSCKKLANKIVQLVVQQQTITSVFNIFLTIYNAKG